MSDVRPPVAATHASLKNETCRIAAILAVVHIRTLAVEMAGHCQNGTCATHCAYTHSQIVSVRVGAAKMAALLDCTELLIFG